MEQQVHYIIEPSREEHGDVWTVPADEATCFAVYESIGAGDDDGNDGELIDTFATRNEAQLFVQQQDEYEVCPVCRGKGTTVNPSIDAHGLTREDFAEDPDFAEMYWSGGFDQPCRACDGLRVVKPRRLRELGDHAAERRMRAAEDGDWEGYRIAGDWRFG